LPQQVVSERVKALRGVLLDLDRHEKENTMLARRFLFNLRQNIRWRIP
jgi:hypothetical protein